jgi:uncharacterized membrane protein YidH (DUF202 family)
MRSALDQPWRDPGLAAERTALAWRRTALCATVATLLAVRTLAPPFADFDTALRLAATAGSAFLTAVTALRREPADPRARHRSPALPTGWLPAATAALSCLTGMTTVIMLALG